jgi:hypothetical protein
MNKAAQAQQEAAQAKAEAKQQQEQQKLAIQQQKEEERQARLKQKEKDNSIVGSMTKMLSTRAKREAVNLLFKAGRGVLGSLLKGK